MIELIALAGLAAVALGGRAPAPPPLWPPSATPPKPGDPLAAIPAELRADLSKLIAMFAELSKPGAPFKKGHTFKMQDSLAWDAKYWEAPWNGPFSFQGAVLADKALRGFYKFKDGMAGARPYINFPKNWPAKGNKWDQWLAFKVDHAHDLYDRVKSAGGIGKIPWKISIQFPGDPNAFERGLAKVAEWAPKIVGVAAAFMAGKPPDLAKTLEGAAAELAKKGQEAALQYVNQKAAELAKLPGQVPGQVKKAAGLAGWGNA